jgi:GT2 family glycosyltransferase/VanZ family protein
VQVKALRIASWALLAVIVFLSVVPAAVRPGTGAHQLEHFAIFFLMGVLFAWSYSADRALLTKLAIFAAAVEAVQLFIPGRHARLEDLIVDLAAICTGVLLASLLDRKKRTSISTAGQEQNAVIHDCGASSKMEPAAKCRLAIVVVTYNSAAVLPGLLDSLSAGLEGIGEFEVVVADNESTDNSVELALSHAIQPTIISMGRNAGYAAAINAAMASVPPDVHILVLNPDVRLLRNSAAVLVRRLMDPSVGVAVPRILAEDGTTRQSLRREPSIVTTWADAILGGAIAARLGLGEMIGDPAIYERSGAIEWATGAVLAVAARARGIVGTWDESFFLYMEEVDYLRRVRESGLSVIYVPEAHTVHIEGEYSQNPRLSALLAGNRIRYYRRHHGPLSTALFRLSVIVGEGLRAVGGPPGHKAAALAALTSWRPSDREPRGHSADALRP